MKECPMKDIINLNAKETNIAIVWAVLFCIIISCYHTQFLTQIWGIFIQGCIALLMIMHLNVFVDIFASIKQKLPRVMGFLACLGQCIKHTLIYIVLVFLFMLLCVKTINDEEFMSVFLGVKTINDEEFMSVFLYVLMLMPFYWLYRFGLFIHTILIYVRKKENYPIAIGYQLLNKQQKINAVVMGLFWGCILYFFHTLVVYQDIKNNFPKQIEQTVYEQI